MSRSFFRGEALPSTPSITVRLGLVSAPYGDTELWKFVKPSGESGHVLCAVGDNIDGYITAVEAATSGGFGIGSINRVDPKFCTAEGSQDAGTGALAIGDFVVAGTPVAKGTDGKAAHPKVRKATIQVGTTAVAAVGDVAPQLQAAQYMWKVVSLGTAGTGAVGTTVLIERIGGPGK